MDFFIKDFAPGAPRQAEGSVPAPPIIVVSAGSLLSLVQLRRSAPSPRLRHALIHRFT